MGLPEIGSGSTISGATTTTLGELRDFDLPGASAAVIDATHMLSANNAMEKFAGLIDGGNMSVTARYSPVDSIPLYASVGLANEVWTITLATGATLVFTGFIQAIGGSVPVKDLVEITFTIEVSGLPVYTASA